MLIYHVLEPAPSSENIPFDRSRNKDVFVFGDDDDDDGDDDDDNDDDDDDDDDVRTRMKSLFSSTFLLSHFLGLSDFPSFFSHNF